MAGRTVWRGGVVFDGTGRAPERLDVAAEDGRIVEIGEDLAGDETVELGGAVLFPGFIDCHSHVAFPGGDLEEVDPAPGLLATLRGGITTVRDAAFATATVREDVAAGRLPGPRLLVSLVQLGPSDGPYGGEEASTLPPGTPYPLADGPEALRAWVRTAAELGADVIKVFATGHFAMADDGARRAMFDQAEMDAIVDEARRLGRRVMAHAHGDAGAAIAARAGVASVDHGFYLADNALAAMVEAGTVFVPTLSASASMGPGAVADGHRDIVRRAHALGIPIAMGTDSPVAPHGRNLDELALLVACGLSPVEALVAATSRAAALLGLEDEIGRIAPGFAADLVAVSGDPLDLAGMPDRIIGVWPAGRRVADGPA